MLTDRDIATDLLLSEKMLAMWSGIAELECTHPQLRSALHQLHHRHEQLHHQVFQAMYQRGWYETPVADPALVSQVAQLWSQRLAQVQAPQAAAPAGAGAPLRV